jgi:tight adherence protein C
MVAASAPVAWLALSGDRPLTHRVSQNLSDHQPTMRQAVLQRSAGERVVLPVIRSVGMRLLRFTPIGWVESKNKALAKAGLSGRITAEQVLGAKLVLPLTIGALMVLRLIGSEPALSSILTAAACTLASFVVPDFLVRARADRRAEAITLALPDMLDQLTISVEAGLGFEAALARLSQTNDNPLAQEFARMLQDLRLGTSRSDALDALAERCQVDDLKTVVLALRQADALGVPLARTLRSVSMEMREKRRFRAEERAHRLPILMIFPLGVCILPALFIVILGPAVITYMQVF